MPPKHKKKLTESEVMESLTKPDSFMNHTTDSSKSLDEEPSEIDLNPAAKKLPKGKQPKAAVEHKKTEAEVLAVVVDEDDSKPAKRSSRKKTVTETEPVTIEPPKKATRGRAKSQTNEVEVSPVEAPKKPGRKPGMNFTLKFHL